MTVYIYHTGSTNLPTLLTQLQPQLSSRDDIYIVGGRDTIGIAKKYGSVRCYIFVEIGLYTFGEGLKFAIESMKDNEQEGLLVIDENIIISATLIQSMKRAGRDYPKYQTFCPIITQMDANFRWFAHPLKISPLKEVNPRCYYTLASGFDLKPALIESEMVVHLS